MDNLFIWRLQGGVVSVAIFAIILAVLFIGFAVTGFVLVVKGWSFGGC